MNSGNVKKRPLVKVTFAVKCLFFLISQVNLKECDTFDLKTLKGPSDYTAVANSTEAMEKIEACMKIWIKQIEQVKEMSTLMHAAHHPIGDVQIYRNIIVIVHKVLAESDQLRKEADDLGPRAELDHWKKRMSRFNYLLDQLKSPNVKAVLGVLMIAKSKLIKVLTPILKLKVLYLRCFIKRFIHCLHLPVCPHRHGRNWTSGSQILQMRPRTM